MGSDALSKAREYLAVRFAHRTRGDELLAALVAEIDNSPGVDLTHGNVLSIRFENFPQFIGKRVRLLADGVTPRT